MSKWSFESLQNFIDSSIEESLSLDYKHADALGKDDKSKFDITKDISAMANSEGGIIVYGVREKNHLPKSITLVDRVKFTREWLESIISNNIFPKIQGIIINTLISPENPDMGAYIIDIPKSNTAHQAKDFRYYRRYNFESTPMSDSEIRDVMNRGIRELILKKISGSFGLLYAFFTMVIHRYFSEDEVKLKQLMSFIEPHQYNEHSPETTENLSDMMMDIFKTQPIFNLEDSQGIEIPSGKGFIRVITEGSLEPDPGTIPVSYLFLQGLQQVMIASGNALTTYGPHMGIDLVEDMDKMHEVFYSAVSVIEPILANRAYLSSTQGRIDHDICLYQFDES